MKNNDCLKTEFLIEISRVVSIQFFIKYFCILHFSQLIIGHEQLVILIKICYSLYITNNNV